MKKSSFFERLNFKTIFLLVGMLFCAFPSKFCCGQIPLNVPQGRLIRDNEIETIFRDYANPIFKVANINPYDFKIFLLSDSSINAFATLGNVICINTGLVLHCQDGEEFLGVLAHEIGHVAGRHVLKFLNARDESFYHSLIPLLIGAAVSGFTHDMRGIMAGSMASSSVYNEMSAGYTHTQECSADQFACKAISQCGWSLKGLKRFMHSMKLHEAKHTYLRTHPFFSERIQVVESHTEKNKGSRLPTHFQEDFFLVKAKIAALTLPAPKALPVIRSMACPQYVKDYGMALVVYREEKPLKALEYLDQSLRDNPRPEFIHGVKAFIFLEKQDIAKAHHFINLALSRQSNNVEFLTLKMQIDLSDPKVKNLSSTIRKLEPLIRHPIHRFEPGIWYFLGIAHGRMKNIALMRLYLAEHWFLMGDFKRALSQLEQALPQLKSGSPEENHGRILKKQIEKALKY